MLINLVKEKPPLTAVNMTIDELIKKGRGKLIAVFDNTARICHLENKDYYGIMDFDSFNNCWSKRRL